MRKTLALILVLSFLTLPIMASAQDSRIYYTFAPYNCSFMGDIDQIANNFVNSHEIFITASPFTSLSEPNMSQISLGIGVFIVKFNKAYAPTVAKTTITVNNESAIDMLINFTYTNGEFYETPNATPIACKYLIAYLYLFGNHSVFNPGPIEISEYYKANPNFNPASIALSPNLYPINLRIALDTSTETSTGQPDLLWLVPVCVAIVAIVVYIVYERKVIRWKRRKSELSVSL